MVLNSSVFNNDWQKNLVLRNVWGFHMCSSLINLVRGHLDSMSKFLWVYHETDWNVLIQTPGCRHKTKKSSLDIIIHINEWIFITNHLPMMWWPPFFQSFIYASSFINYYHYTLITHKKMSLNKNLQAIASKEAHHQIWNSGQMGSKSREIFKMPRIWI